MEENETAFILCSRSEMRQWRQKGAPPGHCTGAWAEDEKALDAALHGGLGNWSEGNPVSEGLTIRRI